MGTMRRIFAGIDCTLERMATDVYGPLPAKGRPPSLWVKLVVLASFGALLAIGFAAW